MPIPPSTQSLLHPALKAYLEARDALVGESIDWDYDTAAFAPTDAPKGLIAPPYDVYDEQTFFDLTYTPIEWRVVLQLMVGASTREEVLRIAADWNAHLVKSIRYLKFFGTVYQGRELWTNVDVYDHPAFELVKNESDQYTCKIQFVLSWNDDGAVVGRD